MRVPRQAYRNRTADRLLEMPRNVVVELATRDKLRSDLDGLWDAHHHR